MNAANAPAGNFFVGLQAPDGLPTGSEVSQCKLYTADQKATNDLFQREYDKSVSGRDFFMFITTAESEEFPLLENSGIVHAGNWFAYYGPWANRLFMFHRVFVSDDMGLY